ncbi:hypothetical protein D3C85_469730 [compost metagenome]
MKAFSKINIAITICFLLLSSIVVSQVQESNEGEVKIGAYYFDGWTGTYSYHITPELVKSFSNRESKWGWITSSQKVMNDQIELAANSGLSFFSFCWYYNGKDKYKDEPLNRSLGFFLNSPNINKLNYTLLVANHAGFIIGPDDWTTVSNEWISQFKSKSYLRVEGKPLITFFSLNTLIDQFKTADKVKNALNQLRSQAVKAGLQGVSVAIVLGPTKKDVELAEACGFDILTGYNYHTAGFASGKTIIPIEDMQSGEISIWNQFSKLTKLPYIPVTTVNWDPRPWANAKNNYSNAPYFVGLSDTSIFNSVKACKNWLLNNSNNSVQEKIGIIYAWNEYGEGAYLTPTKEGFEPLKGVSKALGK